MTLRAMSGHTLRTLYFRLADKQYDAWLLGDVGFRDRLDLMRQRVLAAFDGEA